MSEFGFWGDVVLFIIFIIVMSFSVPLCCTEAPLQPFLAVRKGLTLVFKLALLAALSVGAVAVFAGVAVVIAAFVALVYICAFIYGICRGIFSLRK